MTDPGGAVRRLGPGDERIVARLARDDATFGLDEPGAPPTPLDDDAAAAYLADPAVLHWAAFEGTDGEVVGHLLCYVERRRSAPARQVLLYDVGVHRDHRRRGVGRSLLAAMTAWMDAEGVADAWVPSDTDAVAFYEACGFTVDDDQPVQMTMRRPRP